MALITSESQLADIILREPALLPVLTRFGIGPTVGDATVAEASVAHGIPAEFMLAILNTYINSDYLPERALRHANADRLIDYFTDTYAYYLRFSLPNIRRHLTALTAGAEGRDMEIINRFFAEVEGAVTGFVNADIAETFPAVKGGRSVADAERANPDEYMALLDDFNSMMVRHLDAKCDPNLFHAVLTATTALRRDLDKNSRIRERILLSTTNRGN